MNVCNSYVGAGGSIQLKKGSSLCCGDHRHSGITPATVQQCVVSRCPSTSHNTASPPVSISTLTSPPMGTVEIVLTARANYVTQETALKHENKE